jgi:hypothetical protein
LVYIATTPTELIVTDGEPQYAPIEGTNLLAVTNTTANVFKDLDDQQTYVLLSGRWFRGPSNNGPWENVAGGSLPRDFALIPDASAKENAKASVPGTPQAAEAVIANTIPTTAKVDRAASVQLPVQIDGEPQLKPVEGTPLRYIFNASIPVIRVDAKSWYAVYSGVWYVATSAGGPWVVADMVPAVIYSIPVTSSLHYVTYVRIYNATPRYVYVGYTPGYYGTVIAPDGTVVYGTGYRYPAYVSRRHWFAPIVTYGYGCGMRWTPWYGWSFGFGFGWGYPDAWAYPPAPYWGPFFIERHYFRRQFRTWGISTALNAYYRSLPPPAHSRQYGQAYNSRTGNRIVGIASAINNVAHQTPAAVSPGARRQMLNKAAPPARERRGIVSPGSVFGTREGRVYSYESRGNRWQHLNPPPAARRPPAVSVPEALSREKAARDQGDSRANNYQQYGTPPHQEERQGPPGIVSPGQGILRQQQGGGKKSRSEKRHSKHSDGNGR